MPRETDPVGRPSPVRWLAAGIVIAALLAGVIGPPSAPVADAANVSLSLFAKVSGWSLISGGETNPGPTIEVDLNDHVSITLKTEDAPAEHGLFIDYNNNSQIDIGTDFSGPVTTGTVTFSLDATRAGSFWYYCSIHSGPPYDWQLSAMRGRWIVNAPPKATFTAPVAGTSWTGGVVHDIAFNLQDEDPPGSLTLWANYSYNAGAVSGTIAGPIPGTTNPNVVSWTPTVFDATDVVINVTAVDTRGLYGSSLSPPFEVDSTPPMIAGRSPAPNDVGVARTARVIVAWSEGMNEIASGAADAFAVRRVSDGAWIPGSVTWSPDGTQMTFAPAALWDATTTFEVHVNATATDDSAPGNALAGPDTWQFMTGTAGDTTPPTITNVVAIPATQDAGGSVSITADVTDDIAVASVSAHVVGPSTDVNLTMANPSGPTWTASRMYADTGSYAFTVWAVDTSGNANSRTGSFTVQDRTAPVISSVAATPSSTTPNGAINLTATVTDTGVVASVTVHVVGPGFDANLTMAAAGGSAWFVNRTYTTVGSYAFTVWALDGAGNANSRAGSFSIAQGPPPPAPAMVMANAQANGTILVTWSAVSGGSVAGYNVYRGTTAGGPFAKLTSTPVPASASPEYLDRTAQSGVTYYYVVTSLDASNNESPYSAAATATVPAPPAGPDYTPWILVGVAIIAVLAIVAFVRMRRRAS